jgi:hypothetical protein
MVEPGEYDYIHGIKKKLIIIGKIILLMKIQIIG